MRRPLRPGALLAAVAVAACALVATPGTSASAPTGTLDPTFADNGVFRRNIRVGFTSDDTAEDVAVQADGRIVAVGASGSGDASNLTVVRLTPDGVLDPTFGAGGIVQPSISPTTGDTALAVAILDDGRILVAGTWTPSSGSRRPVFVRLLADGSLDPSFGTGGIVRGLLAAWPSDLTDAVVTADGAVVAVGTVVGGTSRVLRLLADGTVDGAFGTAGVVDLPGTTMGGVAVAADGRVVVGGSTTATLPHLVAARLTATGALDPTFGGDGIVEVPPRSTPETAADVVLQPDGRVVLSGAVSAPAYTSAATMARLLPDGTLDGSFGSGGWLDVVQPGMPFAIYGMTAQPDGKLVAVGGNPQSISNAWVALRVLPSGVLDPTFDGDGSASVAVSTFGTALAAAVGPNDVYVVGYNVPDRDFVVLDLDADATGAPPTSTTTAPPTTTPTTTPTGPPTTVASGAEVGARYVALAATRLLDTRTAPAGKPAPGAPVEVTVTGTGRAPVGSRAVVLNVTATEADAAGYVTVWPAGAVRPEVSNLNVGAPGATVANLVTVQVPASGAIALVTQSGAHLVVDLVGAYVPVTAAVRGGRFQPVAPVRILDTRALGTAPSTVDVSVAAVPGLPAGGVTAIVANLTATGSARAGYVTAWPRDAGAPPATSNLNVDDAGQTRANQMIVAVGDGTIRLATASGAHLLVDVVGYLTDDTAPASTAGLFVAAAPVRVWDTRTGLGGRLGALAAGEQVDLAATAAAAVAHPLAIVGNVTATEAAAPGYVSVWPTSRLATRPEVSTVNLDATGQTRANHVMLPVSSDGQLSAYSEAGTHLVLDLAGVFRS